MVDTIDFSKGGYNGDAIEETFKPFTAEHMPFWWHFREVLRANHLAADYWKKSDGTVLGDAEQRELVALSLLNYAVYTGMAEAIAFFEEMQSYITKTASPGERIFQVRRTWKAMYSSLYSSFNALCNIVVVVVGHKSPFGEKPSGVWNYTPRDAHKLVNGHGMQVLAESVGRCRSRLEIRDHLDHYWTIWTDIGYNQFLMDKNFAKGYVPIHAGVDISTKADARQQSFDHLVESAKDFNLIFHELAVKDGLLEQYLRAKAWTIDYAGADPRHNGSRPLP